MRVLIVKTSSMGDVIHTLPALTDTAKAIPNIQFDWMVEEAFVAIPSWHPAVRKVIPVGLRRWRKNMFSTLINGEFNVLRTALKSQSYDLVIDAQGLIKSALLSYLAPGKRCGLDWRSAREKWSSLLYQQTCSINFKQHAIIRMRQLFSQALQYALPNSAPDFSIHLPVVETDVSIKPYVVFLHGTTWTSKLWPETYWIKLAELAAAAGYQIKISGGNEAEIARAHRIALASDQVHVLPKLSITCMANLLNQAVGAIAVDTGFGHLAAALNKPTLSLYGSTDAQLTGAIGPHSVHFSASSPECTPCLRRTCHYKGPSTVVPACYEPLTPKQVWQKWSEISINYKSEKGQFNP